MTGDELRRTIVVAAMPLLGEFETLTMAEIAAAAGVGEAELLAVFADKYTIFQACLSLMATRMGAVMDPAAEVARLEAIRVDQPIAARLVEVVDILGGYHRRVRSQLEALERDGLGNDADPLPESRNDFRSLTGPETRATVVRLLTPDQASLRLPAEALAEMFLGLSRFRTRAPNEQQPLAPEQVVELFLNGALVTA